MTECAMKHTSPQEAMKDVLVASDGLQKTCIEQAPRTYFAKRFLFCIKIRLYWKAKTCMGKMTDDETKDCVDQEIKKAIEACISEE